MTTTTDELTATYSIGTWDTDQQAYTPQTKPWHNLTLRQLRQAMRELRNIGYGVWRRKHEDDSDWAVLIERTDGTSESEVLEQWKR